MSQAQVIDLAKKILKAQADIAFCYSELCHADTIANRMELAIAQSYLAGLCAAMAPAAKQAYAELKGGRTENRGNAFRRLAELEGRT